MKRALNLAEASQSTETSFWDWVSTIPTQANDSIRKNDMSNSTAGNTFDEVKSENRKEKAIYVDRDRDGGGDGVKITHTPNGIFRMIDAEVEACTEMVRI